MNKPERSAIDLLDSLVFGFILIPLIRCSVTVCRLFAVKYQLFSATTYTHR